MDNNTFDPSNAYRRNLLVVCMVYLIFFFAEGRVANDALTFGLIGIELGKPDSLIPFALLLLTWTGFRYAQEIEHRSPLKEQYKSGLAEALNGNNCSTVYNEYLRYLIKKDIESERIAVSYDGDDHWEELVDQNDILRKGYLRVFSTHRASLFKINATCNFSYYVEEFKARRETTQFNYVDSGIKILGLQLLALPAVISVAPGVFMQSICKTIFAVTYCLYMYLWVTN